MLSTVIYLQTNLYSCIRNFEIKVHLNNLYVLKKKQNKMDCTIQQQLLYLQSNQRYKPVVYGLNQLK